MEAELNGELDKQNKSTKNIIQLKKTFEAISNQYHNTNATLAKELSDENNKRERAQDASSNTEIQNFTNDLENCDKKVKNFRVKATLMRAAGKRKLLTGQINMLKEKISLMQRE